MKTTDFSPHEIRRELQTLFQKYPFVRAFYQNISGLTVTANLTQSIAEPTFRSRGIVITIMKDRLLFEASTSLSSMRDLKKLIYNLENHLGAYKKPQQEVQFSQEDHLEKNFEGRQGKDISLEKKISIALDVVKKIKEVDSSVVMSQVRYKHTLSEEFYISKNKILSQRLSRFEAVFIAVLKNFQGNSTQIYDGYGYQGGWERAQPPEEMLIKMITDGEKNSRCSSSKARFL